MIVIVTLIDFIDLSDQIIEIVEESDDGYCKILIWDLKDGVIETFSCPHSLKSVVSSGNRGWALFRTKQKISLQNWPSTASMYTEMVICKTDQIACSWSSTLVNFAFSSINDRTSCSCFLSPVSNPGELRKINLGLLLSVNGQSISCVRSRIHPQIYEHSPSSYYHCRCKDTQLHWRLIARASFCWHSPTYISKMWEFWFGLAN